MNPFNIKAVMLDIPEPSMLELRMQNCAGSSELCRIMKLCPSTV